MIEKIVAYNDILLDHFVAISLLKSIFPDAEIEYLHPFEEIPKEYIQNPKIALIGISDLDFELDDFNHSDFSSTLLVVRKSLPELLVSIFPIVD